MPNWRFIHPVQLGYRVGIADTILELDEMVPSGSKARERARDPWSFTRSAPPLRCSSLLCSSALSLHQLCCVCVPRALQMVIVAQPSVEERQKSISRKFRGKSLRNLEVAHVVGNPLSRTDVKAALMQARRGRSGASGEGEKASAAVRFVTGLQCMASVAFRSAHHHACSVQLNQRGGVCAAARCV